MLPASSITSIFVFSFLLAIAAVLTPGPVATTIVSQSPRRGWITGPLVASGHAVMELVLIVLITFGLERGLTNPGVQIAISILGGLLLAYMGAAILLDLWRRKVHLPGKDEKTAPMSARQLVGMGMLATVGNPFWYAWWVTVAPGYLLQAKAASLGGVAAFYLGHVTADYTWDTALSSILGGGRRWMNDTGYRSLLFLCGAFFIYLAVVFMRQGIIAWTNLG